MNTNSLLAIAWSEGGRFDSPYAVASVIALLFSVWLVIAVKRTADQSHQLKEEESQKRREIERETEIEEERERNTPSAPLLLTALFLLLGGCGLALANDIADDDAKAKETPPSITVGAVVETYFGWNFNQPANGVTAFRGFDSRHDSFALSNAVIDTHWTAAAVSGRLALQTGDTPDIYYGSEATSDVRHILEATIAWKAPVGKGLTLDGGIFLSPIGPETVLIKDNWNWSRSTLFYGLPFYHAGVRATYPVTDKWNVTAAVFNGWNSVTDTNHGKSLSVQALYTKPDKVTASLLYFGGVERPTGAPEGQLWRNLFDSHITVTVSPTFSFQAHADGGFESTTFGRASWRAGAFSARLKTAKWLYLAGRADILDETVPASSAGSAAALFFPAKRVRSLTATLDARPADHMSVRVELRRDVASQAIYFKRADVSPSATSQTTLTFGLTAWF